MMKGGMKYKQGEIVLIPFPYTDFSTGKQRPALVLSNNKMDKFEDIICCLVTSNPSKSGLLIKKNHFEKGKLPFKSWIKPHRIFTIDSKIVKKRVCLINKGFFDEVLEDVLSYVKRK